MDNLLRKDNCNIVSKYEEYLPEFINKKEVKRLVEGQMSGRANGSRLYALIMLGIATKNIGI